MSQPGAGKPVFTTDLSERQRRAIPLQPDVTTQVRILRGARLVTVLELAEETSFQPGGCIPAPLPPQGGLPAPVVLAAALEHARSHPTSALLVAAHAEDEALSRARAARVLELLRGDRAGFAAGCQAGALVQDWQGMLRFAARTLGFDCDPGPIDGVAGEGSLAALRRFREAYAAAFAGPPPAAGAPSEADWGAFFDVVQARLARSLGLERDALSALQRAIPLAGAGGVGCAGHWPLDRVRLEGYPDRSARRVDLAFFVPKDVPALACHAAPACAPQRCDLYRKNKYTCLTLPFPARRGRTQRLELSDTHFHFESAVFLPDEAPGGAGAAAGEGEQLDEAFWRQEARAERDLRGGAQGLAGAFRAERRFAADATRSPLRALLVPLLFALGHRDRALLVAGHTDRAGQPALNDRLSAARAASVAALLTGERAAFVAACEAFHAPEDEPRMLRYAAASRGWPCDPGPGATKAPRAAVEAFQRRANEDLGLAPPVAVDGRVGRETFAAWFELLTRDLEASLGGAGALARARAALSFVDERRRGVGCGERFPREQAAVDGLALAANRRTELLFFEPQELPADVGAHGEGVYAGDFAFDPLEASDLEGGAPPDEGAEPRPPRPDPLETEMGKAERQGDPSNPWDFARHFLRHHPRRFGAQLLSEVGDVDGAAPPVRPDPADLQLTVFAGGQPGELVVADGAGRARRAVPSGSARDVGRGFLLFAFDPATLPAPAQFLWRRGAETQHLGGPCDPAALRAALLAGDGARVEQLLGRGAPPGDPAPGAGPSDPDARPGL